MRFMMIMFPPKSVETRQSIPDDPEPFIEMGRYNDELMKAGVLLGMDGLHPTSKGVRVSVKNGKKQIVDGPFTEAKEIVGGYWIIQVRSREEAVEWASRVPLHEDGAFVELRQIYEISEFPESVKQKLDFHVAKQLGNQV
jgi:hypothetical protein